MCRGYLVEEAPREVLFSNPIHPYTQALLAAVPDANLDRPLDFGKLKSGRFSDPSRWAMPFLLDEHEDGHMTELEPGHFVRVNASYAATGPSLSFPVREPA